MRIRYGKDAGIPEGASIEAEELTAAKKDKKPSDNKEEDEKAAEKELNARKKYRKMAETALKAKAGELCIRLFDIRIRY